MKTLTFSLLALFATGCTSQTTDPTDQVVAPTADARGPFPMGQVDAPSDSPHFLPVSDSRHFEASMGMFRAAGDEMTLATEILKSDVPLAEMDRRMRDVFASADDLPRDARWFIRVNYGMDMLQLLLDRPDASPEAIGFYAEALADHRNPNADVLADAFDRLGDTWSAERLAEARAGARDGALDWLSRTACETCRTAQALRAEYPDGEGLDQRNREILAGLERLGAE